MSTDTAVAKDGLLGLARLMRRAFVQKDLAELGSQLIARSEADPGDAEALMDLATILHINGNARLALGVQAHALDMQKNYCLPATGRETGLTLLALMAPGDLSANMPIEALLEDSDVRLEMLYLRPGEPMPESVPDHDVAIVAMSESEANRELLALLADFAPVWPRPMLNPPERVARLSRDGASDLLRNIPGVVMPVTRRLGRAILERIAEGELAPENVLGEGGFPLIVRPLDSHAGHGLAKVEDGSGLAVWLGENSANQAYVAPFVDYSGSDGLFRKYRVVVIGGQAFAGHMAISSHWMIHYMNAHMADSAEKRQEEADFMAGFDTGFGARHGPALAALHQRLGLDYFGVDCAETLDGRLLVFEVDHAMIVHAMDPVDIFPYKQPQMKKVFAAFRQLLENARNGQGGQP